MKQVRSLVVLATLCCIGPPALAQQKPPPTEEPGWAKGRPKTDTAMQMAPIPAFPIPTAPDKLPTSKFKLPPGFKVETWASGVLDARGLREGAKGNIFVSSLFVANKVYVIPEQGNHKPKVIIDKLPMATGIELIGTLPPVPPPPPATPPDPIRMARGQALAEQHKCVFCHGAGLGGGEQVPRIGGQHEDYLQASLRGFHSGSRPGYTQAMTAAVSQIPPEDLDTLAYYAARFRGPAGALTGK